MSTPYIVKSYTYYHEKDDSSTAPTLQKLYEHFQDVSTLWEIDQKSFTTDTSKAFTIKPKFGFQFQINFRRYDLEANKVNVTIDPDSLITNAETTVGGDDESLPLTSSAKSFNSVLAFNWPDAANVGDSFWLIELDNAIFILNKLTDTRSKYGLHVGRVFTPIFENDPQNGMEGFGIFGNTISIEDTNPANVPVGSYLFEPSGYRVVKVSNTLGKISETIRIRPILLFDSTSWTMAGRYQPDAYIISTNQSDVNACREIGFAKYFHRIPFILASGTIFVDRSENSDQAFLYNRSEGNGIGSDGLLIPWEQGVSIF
jgi:hypothetical protein